METHTHHFSSSSSQGIREHRLAFSFQQATPEVPQGPEVKAEAEQSAPDAPETVDTPADVPNAAQELQNKAEADAVANRKQATEDLQKQIGTLEQQLQEVGKIEGEESTTAAEIRDQIASKKRELSTLSPEAGAGKAVADVTEEAATAGTKKVEGEGEGAQNKKQENKETNEKKEPLSEDGQKLADSMRGLGISQKDAESLARGLQALAALVKSIKEMFGQGPAQSPNSLTSGPAAAPSTPTESGEKPTEAGQDVKNVQNPKAEAEKLGDPAKQETELEAQLQELGKKLDGSTDATERGDVMKQMQDLNTKLTDVEKNMERKTALEKEQQRREGVVKEGWEKATKASGLTPEKQAVTNVELKGDGDDLVVTFQDALKSEGAMKTLSTFFESQGIKVTANKEAGTLQLEGVPPTLFSEEGLQKLQSSLDLVAQTSLEKKTEPEAPASEEPVAEATEDIEQKLEWQKDIQERMDRYGYDLAVDLSPDKTSFVLRPSPLTSTEDAEKDLTTVEGFAGKRGMQPTRAPDGSVSITIDRFVEKDGYFGPGFTEPTEKFESSPGDNFDAESSSEDIADIKVDKPNPTIISEDGRQADQFKNIA